MELYKGLRDGIVLSEMASKSDGRFCAEYGKGASLVMMGSYIIDPRDDIPYSKGFYFKPGPKHYYEYLKENIALAKESGAKVGISALSVDLQDSIVFLKTAEELGADYLSYCAHSVMDMFIKTRTSSELCKKENWAFLKNTLDALKSSLNRPLIIKIGVFDNPDVIGSMTIMAEKKIDLFHINFKSLKDPSPGLGVLKDLKKDHCFVIAGGGVEDIEDAARALGSGADAVSVGTAALKDKDLCMRLKKGIRKMGLSSMRSSGTHDLETPGTP